MLATLRKNNKKIMAVIGVFLMIAFGWPTNRGGRNQARRGGDVLGRIGSDSIYDVEYQNARAEWEVLNKELRLGRRRPDGRMSEDSFSFAEWELIKRINAATPQQPVYAVMYARRVVQQMEATTYLLLLREARNMDIHPGRDTVGEAMSTMSDIPGSRKFPLPWLNFAPTSS